MKMKKQSTQSSSAVIGIDLGDKKHAGCVLGNRGDADKEFDIPNRKESLLKLAEDYPGARVAIEVGTHSPWTSRLLRDAALSVTVANARRVRANIVLSVRGLLKSIGERVPPVSTAAFSKRVRGHLPEAPELLAAVGPALESIDVLTAQIKTYDQAIADAAQNDYPQAVQLQQIAGVGPVTSLCFVLSVEDPGRFPKPRDVGPWLGLVPKRDQSGETDRELPVSKAGNRYLRSLLVQCAHYLLGPHGPDCDLRRHGLKLAARGGRSAKKKATVAISRKLAVLMLAMWQNQSEYVPLKKAA